MSSNYAAERAAVWGTPPGALHTISDESVIAYIRAYGPIRFARIVAAFDLEDASEDDLIAHNSRIALKQQLQRLRKCGELHSDNGQRWYVRGK